METDIFDLIKARYEIIDKKGLEKLIFVEIGTIGNLLLTRDEILSLTNYIQLKALRENLIR
ncbi:MAG: hypothetical protein ACYCT7_01520 [bacterium]